MISEVGPIIARSPVSPYARLIQPQKMNQFSGYLFLSLLAGLWHTTELEANELDINGSPANQKKPYMYCFRMSSEQICVAKFLNGFSVCRRFIPADHCKLRIYAELYMDDDDETTLETNSFQRYPDQKKLHDVIPGRGFLDGVCMESNDELHEHCYNNVSSLFEDICKHSEEKTSDDIATEIIATDEMQSPTSKDFKSSVLYPSSNPSSTLITRSSTKHVSINEPESSSVSFFYDGEPSDASNTTEILLITFLFMAAICIVVAVILVIRRRKLRNNGSPKTNTQQGEAVLSAYASVAPDNRPSEGTAQHSTSVYVDVEMVQRSIPSNNTTNASVQPIGVYEELDFPSQMKQQKPKNLDNITTCLSPVYSQPFEPPASSNTLYAEPFKPDQRPNADIQSQHAAAVDQQNMYSLEKAIPMGDPKAIYSEPKKSFGKSTANIQGQHSAVDQKNIYSLEEAIPIGDPSTIYSEPNKPSKSPGTIDEREQAAGPVCLETIQNKLGAGSGDVSTSDPSVVYAEPMKLENSTSGRTEVLPLKKASQNNEAIIGDKRPSDDTRPVYTEFELTKQPMPSDTNIYDNFKPTEEAVDTSVVYANPQV